jgi:hypothetical protein
MTFNWHVDFLERVLAHKIRVDLINLFQNLVLTHSLFRVTYENILYPTVTLEALESKGLSFYHVDPVKHRASENSWWPCIRVIRSNFRRDSMD